MVTIIIVMIFIAGELEYFFLCLLTNFVSELAY